VKKAVILHAMEQDSQGHWYPWLKNQLEDRGYEVWVPILPSPEHPDTVEMTKYLLSMGWDFNKNLLIGHSSGAVEILYLLQALSEGINVETAVLAGSFEKPVTGMEEQHDKMFVGKLNFEKIKTKASNILFMHGEDDPWCPLEGAKNLAKKTDGELVAVSKSGHFSTSLDSKYTEFPELITELEARGLL
jgi:predicted alpha/beta hydrolase family esterase